MKELIYGLLLGSTITIIIYTAAYKALQYDAIANGYAYYKRNPDGTDTFTWRSDHEIHPSPPALDSRVYKPSSGAGD